MKQSEYHEQLQPILNKGSLSRNDCKQLNEILENRMHVFDADSIQEPKALINFSEHHLLRNNTMYRFAEANELAGDISYEHFNSRSEEDIGYFKTRYSVITPDENGKLMIFANTDRLDLGDGEYKNMHHQLLRERRWSKELAAMIEEDVKTFNQEKGHSVVFSNNEIIHSSGQEKIYGQLSNEAMNKINSRFNGELEKPLLMVHGVSEFKEFGMVNELPFNELSQQKFDYTAAYSTNEGIKLYSSTFDKNETLTPLHDLEKFEKLPVPELSVVSENWHDYLQRGEDAYLQQVMPRIRQEIQVKEASKTPAKKQRQLYEMER